MGRDGLKVEERKECRTKGPTGGGGGGGCRSGAGLKDDGGVTGVEVAMEKRKVPAPGWKMLEGSCI